MKCPKCGYLGFEKVSRCRNCGYDFSLAAAFETPELPLRDGPPDSDGGPGDLTLGETPAIRSGRTPTPGAAFSELPLFTSPSTPSRGAPHDEDDEPLITTPSAPRAPLAVRRATPDVPRLRFQPPRTPMLDLGGDDDVQRAASFRGRGSEDEATGDDAAAAGLAGRLFAVVVDLAIIAGIDVLVVYFTLQICGLRLDELSVLPKAPLAAFLVLQNLGYFVAFTAAGQTLGKIAAGIRVIAEPGRERLDVGRAILRTALWVALAVPAGLGFLTTLARRDRRGLHDRVAGTRVVRATAH